jgi:CHASE2 domain-containing sensor protein
MTEVGPPEPVLSYATPASLPTQPSRYAIASLGVSGIEILWHTLSVLCARLPFDVYKQDRIGMVASVLALILAVAALSRQHGKRLMAYVAITVASLSFASYILFVPL